MGESDPAFEMLRLDRPDDTLLVVTLNRPEAANAFNTAMGEEMRALWTGLRCIVVTGAGTRAFCAGADLKERREMTDDAWRAQHRIFEEAFYAMMDCPAPIIAAVNGAAFGGGCELALAADFAYAADTARFALPETTLGIMPGVGGTQNLPRACGVRRAREIILTGSPFGAADALAWGIVNRVVPGATLMDETLATAKRIAANAPLAVAEARRALSAASGDLKSGLAAELESYYRCAASEDRREGMLAFNEKRPPVFKGR